MSSPMRCLFIVSQAPLSPNYTGGGAAVCYEQLVSLSQLGHEIHLWHYAYPEARQEFLRFVGTEPGRWDEVQEICKSVTISTLPARAGILDRLRNKAAGLISGEEVHNPVLRTKAFAILQQLIAKTRPQLIWAEHFGPAQVALLQKTIPLVYSHHDWLYKIKLFTPPMKEKMRIAEERVATQSAAVISGSAVECAQLREVGAKNVFYLPVSYEPAPWMPTRVTALEAPRVVHLGGMATTANKVGLERFAEVVWPQVSGEIADFWVIGDVSNAGSRLARFLEAVTCTGYVMDLNEVMRPFDLHLIPWEQNTGQRTRFVQALNYGQVVIATRASVSGFPELVDGENCCLVDRLEDMAEAIRRLLARPFERERIGLAARHTFMNCFTREVLLPRYDEVIQSVIRDENPWRETSPYEAKSEATSATPN